MHPLPLGHLPLLGCLVWTVLLPTAGIGQPLQYPPTRLDSTVEDYHGTKIAAPYQWLEDLASEETHRWVETQDRFTTAHLETIPAREALRRIFAERRRLARQSPANAGSPWPVGDRLFFLRGDQLWAARSAESPEDEDELVFDPSSLSADGTLQARDYAASPDGRLLAYVVAMGGRDEGEIHVLDLSTRAALSDTLRWVNDPAIHWTADGRGFFYSRNPAPTAGEGAKHAYTATQLAYHTLGRPQAEDPILFEKETTWLHIARMSEDGRFVFLSALVSGAKQQLLLLDLEDPRSPNLSGPFVALTDSADALYAPVGSVGSTLYLHTTRDAPRGKVVAVDLASPAPEHWRTVVPEGRGVIEPWTALAGNRLVLTVSEDVQDRLLMYSLDGQPLGEVPLGQGARAGASSQSARSDRPDIFLRSTSPFQPWTTYRYDPRTGDLSAWRAGRAGILDPSEYETRQVFFSSKDGTRVPMFISAKKGLVLDGTHPLLMTGYGGHGHSSKPFYRADFATWLEMGGVFVIVNTRGGGEYGADWHRAGMLENTQNVFDDFIAAAEHLIREGYAAPDRIAAEGMSNGGRLVGVVITQRPDLFRVALPWSGVLDMLRYHLFTVGANWIPEHGSSDDPEMFPVLRAYSPLHNIEPGTCYPATFAMVAEDDDRVVPSHSYKFVAALQAAQGCARPVLLRVTRNASHTSYSPEQLDDLFADMLAFAAAELGMSPPPFR